MTRAEMLLEYARQRPDGFTNDQAIADLRWSVGTFDNAVQVVRQQLRRTDRQLIAVPNTEDRRGRWVYSIAHCSDADARLGRDYHRRKLEGHLETALALADSMAAASDPRSNEGKKDRMIRTALVALQDQLAIIDA